MSLPNEPYSFSTWTIRIGPPAGAISGLITGAIVLMYRLTAGM